MWEPRKDIGSYIVQHSLTLEVAMSKPRRMGGQRARRFKTKDGAQKAADELNRHSQDRTAPQAADVT